VLDAFDALFNKRDYVAAERYAGAHPRSDMDRCQRRAAVAGTTASPISGGIPQKPAIFGSDAIARGGSGLYV
jgi:hypothetical protein